MNDYCQHFIGLFEYDKCFRWFQQDRATCHTPNAIGSFLRGFFFIFYECIIFKEQGLPIYQPLIFFFFSWGHPGIGN